MIALSTRLLWKKEVPIDEKKEGIEFNDGGIKKMFNSGIANVTGLSLETGFTCRAVC